MSEQLIKELEHAESQRIEGLVKKDFELLRKILPQDLTHVHSNGHCQNLEELIDRIASVMDILEVRREKLSYRFFGDTAVAVGTMYMTHQIKPATTPTSVSATVTQTWVRKAGQWVQVAFQSARHP